MPFTEREQAVGLLLETMTYAEIGRQWGVSRERVRQIAARAQAKHRLSSLGYGPLPDWVAIRLRRAGYGSGTALQGLTEAEVRGIRGLGAVAWQHIAAVRGAVV